MPVIYHTGLTPPPLVNIEGFEICYFPMLKVVYESNNLPQDIRDMLQLNPIVLLMSKNAVVGLDKWLSHFSLEADFFAKVNFWTVGDRTHTCLKNILGIHSFHPKEMTGEGVLQALQEQFCSKVLLISGKNLQREFIEGLFYAGINFFHFPVYQTTCDKNVEFSANFDDSESNLLIITSPSAIGGILKCLAITDLSKLRSRIISIGPTTTAAIFKNKGNVFLESEVQNINSLYGNLEKNL